MPVDYTQVTNPTTGKPFDSQADYTAYQTGMANAAKTAGADSNTASAGATADRRASCRERV